MKNKLDLTKFKTSSIGTHIESSEEDLKIEMKFSTISWFFITFFGTTRTPLMVTFTCLVTGEVFEVLTDKKMIKYYMTYEKR